MKRVTTTALLIALFVCAVVTSASADSIPLRLLLGKREITLSPSVIWDGKRVLAPLAILDPLGLSYVVSGAGKSVTVTNSTGKSTDIPTVDNGGTRMLSIDDIIEFTGGETNVDVEKRTLTLTSHLKSVEFDDDTLVLNNSFPASCSVRIWSGKLIVDIADTRLATETKEMYVGTPAVDRARLGQYSPDTARVTLDLTKDVQFKLMSKLPAAQIKVLIGESLSGGDSTPAPQPKPAASKPYTVDGIRVDKVDEDNFNVVISTSGKPTATSSCDTKSPQIVLTLKNGTPSDSLKDIDGTHRWLKNARFTRAGQDGTKVVLDLSRAMLCNVKTEDNGITINVHPPDGAGGTLAGKLVIVDPGHGGHDRGAHFGDINEKDINLKIAGVLASALEEAGAKVIVTRGEEFITLTDRPAIAVKNHADFFISVHCNSNLAANSATGIETYHHRRGESSMILADCIHGSVCSITGMCDRKTRGMGFVVLRELENTGIPAVLVECGYLNNSSDRAKLLSDTYRKTLASSIVAGLKTYIEGE